MQATSFCCGLVRKNTQNLFSNIFKLEAPKQMDAPKQIDVQREVCGLRNISIIHCKTHTSRTCIIKQSQYS